MLHFAELINPYDMNIKQMSETLTY